MQPGSRSVDRRSDPVASSATRGCRVPSRRSVGASVAVAGGVRLGGASWSSSRSERRRWPRWVGCRGESHRPTRAQRSRRMSSRASRCSVRTPTTRSTPRSSPSCARRSRHSLARMPVALRAWSWPATVPRSVPVPTSPGCGPRCRLDVEGNEQDAMAMADMFETIDTCPVPVIARVHGAALGGGMGLCAVPTSSSPRAGPGSASPRRASGSCRRSSPRSSSPRSARAMPARCSPAAAVSTPSGRSASGSSTRSSRATTALDAAVVIAIDDVLAAGPDTPRGRPRPIVREVRGLSHGSAKWHTARVIARQRVSAEAREGFAAFDEKRRPAWAPDPDAS